MSITELTSNSEQNHRLCGRPVSLVMSSQDELLNDVSFASVRVIFA